MSDTKNTDKKTDDSAVDYLSEAYTDVDKQGSEEEVAGQLNVLDNANTDEEVDALLEIVEDDAEKPDTDVPEVDTEKESKIEFEDKDSKEPESNEKPKTDKTIDETPSQNPPEKDKDEDKVNEINEEFIKNYPRKDDLKILEKLKGTKIDNKALKMLIEAQRLIGRKNPIEDRTIEPGFDEINEENPIPENIPLQSELEDENLRNTVNIESLRRLKEKYTNLPTESEELEGYLVDLNQENPEKFYQFQRDKEYISNEVKSALNKGLFIQKNSQKINNVIFKKEANNIIADLKEYGLEDLSEIGVDLNLTIDEKGNYRNALIEELMLDGNNLDSNIVTYIGDKPILLEGQLQNKFFRTKSKTLFQQAIKIAEKRARLEKFEHLEDKKKKTLNSFSESGTGINSGKQRFEDIVNGNDENAIDAVLENIEHNI